MPFYLLYNDLSLYLPRETKQTTMLIDIIALLKDYSFLSKSTIVLLVAGFMPLMAMSYFWFMMGRKEKKYAKNMREMGINTNKKVRDFYSPGKFILPVLFATAICLLAVYNIIFVDDFKNVDSLLLAGPYFGLENTALINQSRGVLSWAFVGGFIWSAQNILRRVISYDLAPNVFYSAGIRIMLASGVALVLSFMLGADNTGATSFVNVRASLPAVAFITGMFPDRMVSYLMRVFEKYLMTSQLDLNTKHLSLDNIQGFSLNHKERFKELGIDNAQNLATASLTKLLIETPYDARQILDWIGQAKLLCYAGQNINRVRAVGIRTVYDLQKGQKSPAVLQRLGDSVGLNQPLLNVIYDQVNDDEGIRALHNFMQKINSPNEPTMIKELEAVG